MKVRIKFSKGGPLKFIGHLDVMRYFQKAIRRSRIPIAYSEGFNPHQIMSFAAPLSVGHTSQGEYLDIEVTSFSGEEEMRERLQTVMVEGIDILQVQLLSRDAKNAMASVAAASYLVTFRPGTPLPDSWPEKLTAFWGQEKIPVVKKTKKGEKEIDLKESIYDLHVSADFHRGVLSPQDGLEFPEDGSAGIHMLLNASSGGNIKPSFVLEHFFASLDRELPPYALMVHRLELYRREEERLVPLIWEK